MADPPAAPSTARPPDLWSSVAGGEATSPGSPDDPWSAAPWGEPAGPRKVEILGPADGRWLVRAPDHEVLCDVLARVPRPPGRLRLAVDPLRV